MAWQRYSIAYFFLAVSGNDILIEHLSKLTSYSVAGEGGMALSIDINRRIGLFKRSRLLLDVSG